jgi:hypothetical protein
MTDGRSLQLEKYLWTDRDFDRMGWHDVKVHAVAFEANDGTFASVSTLGYYPLPLGGRLLLDLDYIIEWERPKPPERSFRFWISPATLVFENVQGIQGGELDLVPGYGLLLDIQSLDRLELHPSGVYDWTIQGHNFALHVSSTGFRQYIRQPPMLSSHQYLSIEARGGISFAEQPVN